MIKRGEVTPDRRTGQSTAQTLSFIAEALRTPNAKIRIWDHFPAHGTDARQARTVADLVQRLSLPGLEVRRNAGGHWLLSSGPCTPYTAAADALDVLVQAIRNPEKKIRVQAPDDTAAANSYLASVIDVLVMNSGLQHLHLSRTPNRRWYLVFENRERAAENQTPSEAKQ